jgi:pyruvate,water dikinase
MTCTDCKDQNDSVLVKGRSAFPGCIIGRVRLLNKPEEAADIESGEILVTAMTDPDSVPAIERAAAVITDRGGILCHAAIVCRELRKPCIVGTQNATKALQNGMSVRVCAVRGVVLSTQ